MSDEGYKRDDKGKFAKGTSGHGRKPLPDDVKEAVQSARVKFIRKLSYYIDLPLSLLQKAKEDPHIDALDACIVSMLLKCIKYGGRREFDALLNRLLGKPTESVHLKGDQDSELNVNIKRVKDSTT